MLLLECGNVKKYFGDRLVIDLKSLRVYSGDRVGIVGANGAGKTTLVNILSGRMEPDQGWVRLYGPCSVISQLEPPGTRELTPEMASKLSVPVAWDENMSGGEQTRFKIAAGLAKDSTLLFADEPLSNVDIDGIELVESMFTGYRGALLLVSHDRSFLDKLCNKIMEIENAGVRLYSGNYSEYSVQKAREREREQFEYLQYIKEKKRLERIALDLKQKACSIKKAPGRMGNSEARLHKMVRRKAMASLDRARENIEKRIEHLEVREKPKVPKEIKLDIADAEKVHSKVILEGSDINKSFGDKVIFSDAVFRIFSGSKVALIGPNGCGKTTLLKMIMRQEAGIKIAPAARIGYFSQDMSILKEDSTVLANVMESSIYPESFVRTLLAGLLFKGEDVCKRVYMLSGGERVKAAFAKILTGDFNLLILDEPTNYLDIRSLEVIEEALQKHEGTILFVSHDRSFIRAVADCIMTIENGKIKVFNGNYSEFLERKGLAASRDKEAMESQVLVLQNRLSDILSRLSLPEKQDDTEALDREYQVVLAQLRQLKKCLGKK